MVVFKELEGSDLGVYHDKNYRLVECFNGHIVFSYAQKGEAMSAHFAADKKGIKNIKDAINAFCEWIFNLYKCKYIFAVIDRSLKSVVNLVKKLNFKYLTENSNHVVYVRGQA